MIDELVAEHRTPIHVQKESIAISFEPASDSMNSRLHLVINCTVSMWLSDLRYLSVDNVR